MRISKGSTVIISVLCLSLYILHNIWNSNNDDGPNSVRETLKSVATTHTSRVDAFPNTTTTTTISTSTKVSTRPISGNVQITSDKYEPGFSFNGSSICPDGGQYLDILILITSAPYHYAHRNAIRLTWGHFSKRRGISIAFLLGKTLNTSVTEMLEKEIFLYDDIIQANFIDSYDNLTLKTLSAFEWVNTYCNHSEFVLKTDDDVFINIPNLLKFIAHHKKGEEAVEPTIYGSLAKKWKPFRTKSSKYYVSKEEFSGRVYPDFTSGPAYLFSPFIAQSLFDKAMRKPYLKLEDVFLTGIVAEEANIKRVDIYEFGSEKMKLKKTQFCKLLQLISIHEVSYHQQFELWKRLFDNRSDCNSTKSMYDAELFYRLASPDRKSLR